MSAHGDRGAALRRLWPWLIPTVALAVFVAPMVLTHSGFMPDWTNHLWLVDRQAANIEAGRPSLYLHAHEIGAFYPQFAFYGGTLYTLSASLAWVTGDTLAVYIASWAAAFAAAFGGTTWFAMQCGLRGWRAQMPGLFLVTSAYCITNAYGRGAWPEFVAVAVIPLLVASSARLLRGPWTPLPLLAFIVSAIVFAGSHNITLLFGTVFLAGTAAAVAIAAWRRPTRIELRRFAALAGVGALCIGVNLWYLLPDIWYANRTRFGVGEPFAYGYQSFLSALGVIFNPLRVMFPELKGQVGERIYLQLPVLAFAWIAAALVLMRRSATRFQRRVTWILVIAATPFAVLTATTEPWHWVPRLFRQVQFAYRLESYVLIAATGLVVVALCEIRRAPRTIARPLTITLGAIMVFSSALAVWQVLNPPEYLRNRQAVLSAGSTRPSGWYDGGTYRDNSPSTPVVSGVSHSPSRKIRFDVDDIHSDTITTVVDPARGRRPLSTNLAAGPYLLDIKGLEVAGRDRYGLLVVRRPADRPTGPITVTISRPTGGPVGIGLAAALVAVIGLLGVVVWTLVRNLLRRSRRSADTADPPPDESHGGGPGEGASTSRLLLPTVTE